MLKQLGLVSVLMALMPVAVAAQDATVQVRVHVLRPVDVQPAVTRLTGQVTPAADGDVRTPDATTLRVALPENWRAEVRREQGEVTWILAPL